MRSSPTLPLAVLVAALVHAAPSGAQTPTGIPAPPDEALSETARELFAKGVAAAGQQRWDQCRAAFLAAYGVKPHPQIAGNLSACEVKLGMYRDAAEHVSTFLRAQRPDAPAERRAAADAVLREASAKIATAHLDVGPSGAEVRLDGHPVGTAPIVVPLFLDPGAHLVEVRQDGYVTVKRPVDAVAGAATEIKIELAPVGPVAPPPPVVVVERRPLWPALVAGGVAIVAVGVGAGLAVAANGKRTDADSLGATLGSGAPCSGTPAASTVATCQAIQGDVTTHDTLAKGALGAFVVGGAFAVAATGLGIWAAGGPKDMPGKKAGLRVAPAVGPGQGGVTVLGIW